ncbi:MAG: HDOD domain-containing protein [Planctomycetaceae bacterium]
MADSIEQALRSGRRIRMDRHHTPPPAPHLFELPNRYELQRLQLLLDDDDLDLQKLRAEISLSEGLQRYILAFANSRVASMTNRITDPVHAFALLGMNRLRRMLANLIEQHQMSATA